MERTEKLQNRIAQGLQWLAKVRGESPGQIAVRLKGYADDLVAALEGLTDPQWTFKPAEDQWSVREVCLHVSNSVRGTAMLTKVLAAGNDGPDDIRMGVLDEDDGAPADEIIDRVRKTFQRADDATRSLGGDVNTEKTAKHPYFGALNCKDWAVFNLMHVSIHIQQIERIKSDANFPK
jgi:hypothetical protein